MTRADKLDVLKVVLFLAMWIAIISAITRNVDCRSSKEIQMEKDGWR